MKRIVLLAVVMLVALALFASTALAAPPTPGICQVVVTPGGSEVTACNPTAAQAILNAGPP
jgi:hypothetical protein